MHFHATHTHAHTIPGPHVHFHGVPAPGPTPAREPRTLPEWAPPPAPGPTLRDRLERRERELGLRCADASCGIGPSDEEPFVEVGEDARRVVALRPAGVKDTDAAVCAHAFHPACLVSAQRARGGWREPVAGDVEVPVVCSVCRAEGFVEMDDWVRGASCPLIE
ncbi:hypothetical protein B0H10DRAFT_1824405 [Mycena sp. CBHHK59/15]|nr:hypothetical protein B0H10DRAFT_1824405 [Mycena sp. CBHHK59/15]